MHLDPRAAEEPVRPVELEVSAPPYHPPSQVLQFRCAFHPPPTRPMRWPAVPIRMIIEGDQVEGGRAHVPEKCGGKMMKIARAVQDERRELVHDLADEDMHCLSRGETAQSRPPANGILPGEAEDMRLPRFVEVQVHYASLLDHETDDRLPALQVFAL